MKLKPKALKPCPCGNAVLAARIDFNDDARINGCYPFWVRCAECGCHTAWYLTADEARQAWNKGETCPSNYSLVTLQLF